MRVRELITALEQYDGDAEVLVAHQPSWPLQETVRGVTSDDQVKGYDAEDFDLNAEQTVVYLAAGGHPDSGPYAPSAVFELAEW